MSEKQKVDIFLDEEFSLTAMMTVHISTDKRSSDKRSTEDGWYVIRWYVIMG